MYLPTIGCKAFKVSAGISARSVISECLSASPQPQSRGASAGTAEHVADHALRHLHVLRGSTSITASPETASSVSCQQS